MPGIVGIIRKNQHEICEQRLHQMIDCMMHEPFYSEGAYVNEKMGAYVGWVCHKGSFSDCMPVLNEKKDLILIFSGEDFADKQITNELKEKGHIFDESNAGYLIHLYEENEKVFLERLNGWFSGILVDLRKEKVVLFNDRYGMNRIYYYEDKEVFLFSSEAKSLLKVRPELRNLDLESLGEFFSCGCVLENRSLFPKVFVMPGGSVWTFGDGKCVRKGHYFTPSTWENQPCLERDAFYQELTKTFRHILPRYFRSTSRVAMSLTGGLDTRIIMSGLDSRQELPCYTFGGVYRDCLDVLIAQKVAAACHQKHEMIRLDKSFFRNFSDHAEKTVYLTDGCHNVCGSHDIFLNGQAREIAPIRVTGKFGGEVLRSVANLKATRPLRDLFSPDLYEYILEAGSTVDEVRNGRPLSYSVFKGIPWSMYGCVAAEQSQLTYRAPFMDNDFVGLLYQAPAGLLSGKEISLRLIADNAPGLTRILTDRGFGERHAFPLSNIIKLFYWGLFKVDWYYGVGMPDWAMKLESKIGMFHLRKLFLGTQRIDHYRMWFQSEISDYVQQILLDRMTMGRPYLNNHFLEHMVESHIKGKRNYTNEINRAMTVELTQRLLIENI